jgi:hypothetical protein
MRKNEPNPNLRIAGPIPFYDANGALKKGLTFGHVEGEVFYYRKATNDWAAASSNATELGGGNTSGLYFVPMAQGETNNDFVVGIKLSKATYDDQYWFAPIDNTPDVSVISMATDVITMIQGKGNGMLDKTVYVGKFLVSARWRSFADAVALAAASPDALDNADGEIARFVLEAADTGDGSTLDYLAWSQQL